MSRTAPVRRAGPTSQTSRAYTTPHRPGPVRVVNALWGRLGAWSRPALDAEAWASAAGLEGADLAPFEVLAESLQREARLHPLGQVIVSARIVGALRARARVEALPQPPHTGLPEPESRPAPLVIVGLQRTGTTLLHRLLSAVPGHRGLRSWEVLNPAPLTGEVGHARRLRSARWAARAVRYLAPDFQAVHPIEPSAPEEEVVLFEQVGLSTGYEATLRVPSYAAWLEAQDQSPAYAWLRRVLQLLQRPGERWVLKTPHHLEFLPDLLAAVPDARLVWTHRDPVVTVPSFCSMVAHGHGLCTDHVDPHEIGRHWLRKTSRMVARGRAFRRAHPEVPVLDLAYDDLVADPSGAVARILAWLCHDAPVRVQVVARHRYGRHAYEAADFGLTESAIRDAFADGA